MLAKFVRFRPSIEFDCRTNSPGTCPEVVSKPHGQSPMPQRQASNKSRIKYRYGQPVGTRLDKDNQSGQPPWLRTHTTTNYPINIKSCSKILVPFEHTLSKFEDIWIRIGLMWHYSLRNEQEYTPDASLYNTIPSPSSLFRT